MKNHYAGRTSRYSLLHLFHGPKHSPGRAASENGLTMRQTPATHDTVQVSDPHTLIGQTVAIKLGPSGGAMPWNESLSRHSTENHAAASIDCKKIGVQMMILN